MAATDGTPMPGGIRLRAAASSLASPQTVWRTLLSGDRTATNQMTLGVKATSGTARAPPVATR